MYTLIIKNVKMEKININLNINKSKDDLDIKEDITKTLTEDNQIPETKDKADPSPPENIKKPSIKLNLTSIKAGSSIEDKKDNESSAKNIEDSINEKEKIESKKDNLFNNYESVFKKEKFNILEHIKKLKALPSTNILFLSLLVALTIAWIWFLFHTNPETHNLDNYKTSILDTYNALTKEQEEKDLWPQNEKINKWWYVFNIIVESLKWKEIYEYEWKYYDDKSELDKIIEVEIDELKKSKVKDTLRNSFIKK